VSPASDSRSRRLCASTPESGLASPERTKWKYRAGTSNPESKTYETAYDDAIIKVDLDRERPTFGQIVATYKGTSDSVTGYDNPVCQNVGGTVWANGVIYGSSPTCGQLDVDFGMGPTLFTGANGDRYAAAAQKSGVLHVIDTTTMKPVWTKQLWPSMSFLGGNLARIAADGSTIYVAGNPGILHAYDGITGDEKWSVPLTGTPMKGGNVALANGVVYYVDDAVLKAFDAADGTPLFVSEPMPGSSIGSAVSVAEHTVLANHYGTVAAYRLPTGS